MKLLLTIAVSLLGFVPVVCAIEAEVDWKAGLATVKITPETPVPMSGYDSRKKPFTKVEQDIYAKALALEDRQGRRAVLVTTDLIGLSRVIAEAVCARIQEKAKLTRDQILLNFAHIHSGPRLSDEESNASGVASEDARNIIAYTRALEDKLADVAVQALSHLELAELSWGSGFAHFAMNRREFTSRGIILGANPRGLVDRSVPVLRVDLAKSKRRAVLFGYACHNTTLTPSNYSLCADYAGFAQSYIQEKEPGVQAMFMIGCGGDADPYPRGSMDDAKENGVSLGREVCRVLDGRLRPVRGPLTCIIEDVSLPLQQLSRDELEIMSQGPSWQSGNAKAMLAKLDRGEKSASSYDAPVAVWQFGGDLTLVGLSGEVVVDYVPLIERAVGPLRLWIAAYCNDVFGYFPSVQVLKEGGYETRGLYTSEGFFAPEGQDILVSKVRELAQRAGRNLLEEGVAVDLGGRKATLRKLDALPYVESDYSKRFKFDSHENPKLKELRKRYQLDAVIAPGSDEFSKQVLLNDWVHQQFKNFGHPSAESKGALEILKAIDEGHAFFCKQYAELLVSAASSLGWIDRPLALRRHQGVAKIGGSTEHSVTEIWSNQYRKWVMLDPTLNMYLEKNGVPLNAFEIRQEWFYRDGKDLVFVVGKDRKKYNKPDLPVFLQHFAGHGDLAIHPDELDKYGFIGYIPNTDLMDSGFDYGKMFIAKDKLCDGTRWHERTVPSNPAVDPYFPIGQAALSLQPQGKNVSVAVKTLTPNFARYEARFDGGAWEPSADAFVWTIHSGLNRMEVRTINEFGVKGSISTAELEVSK